MRKSLLVLIYLIIVGILIILEIVAFVMTLINSLGQGGDFWAALGGLIIYGLQVGEWLDTQTFYLLQHCTH